jgi:hypothetical protein
MRNRQHGTIELHQGGHIASLLEKFNMTDCKPNLTPLPVGLKLEKLQVTPVACRALRYQSAVGKLLYISLTS